MHQRNVLTLEYLDDSERIADYVNVVFFDSNQVVRAEDIQELDTGRRSIWKKWGKVHTRSFTRDILRKVILGSQYFIMGIEHQSQIDYTMPVRIMGYDSGVYEKQIRKLRKYHRKRRDLKGPEFLSGISKSDQLMPAVSGIIYFGEEEWDGPRNLHELLDMNGKLEYLKKWVPNYTINILEVRRYPDWRRFKSDLKQVFGYLQNATDCKTIQQYMKEHKEEYENLAEDAFDMISAVTNAGELMGMKEKNRNNEGRIDMCKALQEWAEMERMEGRAEGKAESVGVIRNMLKQGMTQQAVSHWTGLDEFYIEKIAELNQKFPGESNEKITAVYLEEEQ